MNTKPNGKSRRRREPKSEILDESFLPLLHETPKTKADSQSALAFVRGVNPSSFFRVVVFSLSLCLPSLHATAQNVSKDPYYVAATQVYKFPNTEWTEEPGAIEQVIAEDSYNYVLLAPDGTQVQLPKALARQVSADEAAAGLVVQRQKDFAILKQMFLALKQEQAQQQTQQQALQQSITPEQMSAYLSLIQQLKDMQNPQNSRPVPNQNRYQIQIDQR
jgi:hypothetical protein